MPVDAVTDRRNARVATRIPVVLINRATGRAEYAGVALDASPDGFRVQSSFCPFAPDNTVDVIIMEEPSRIVRCRVAWVATPESGRFGEAGFEILHPSLKVAA